MIHRIPAAPGADLRWCASQPHCRAGAAATRRPKPAAGTDLQDVVFLQGVCTCTGVLGCPPAALSQSASSCAKMLTTSCACVPTRDPVTARLANQRGDMHRWRGKARAAEHMTMSCTATSHIAMATQQSGRFHAKTRAEADICVVKDIRTFDVSLLLMMSHPASAAAAAHQCPDAPKPCPVSPGHTQKMCRRSHPAHVRSRRSAA